jgi:hypothetical protein
MTAELREQLRLRILQLLEASGAVGLKVTTLRIHVAAAGFDSLQPGDLGNEVAYLKDKGFVMTTSKLVSPELERMRITAEGRDFLATEGLA